MITELRHSRKQAVETESEFVKDFLLGIGIILGAIIILISLINLEINDSKILQELSTYGKWAQGKVVNLSRSGEHSQHTTITYQYFALGADGTQQIYQGQSSESGYYIGAPVTVIYSSRQPNLSRIKDDFIQIQALSIVSSIFARYSLIFQILVIGIGSICGVILFIGILPKWKLATAITREGICTSGTVMDLDEVVSYGSKGGRSYKYYVIYEYNVMGQIYSLKERISQNRYRQLKSGMRVDVRYLMDRPDAARLDNSK
jgi:hypothetical protein